MSFANKHGIAEEKSRDQILRAVFPYPGGKGRLSQAFLDILPYRDSYVEPFGGSGSVLLARRKSKIEVFNDRYAGVVAFYRCIRDAEKCRKLVERLDLTIHSREEFVWCRDTWEDQTDDVERAARWYYTINYSFSSLGRNFARTTRCSEGNLAGKIRNKLKRFFMIHNRFQRVQVENQDWLQCMKDYDSPVTVFYCDPPYLDSDSGIYKSKFKKEDHERLLHFIEHCEGYVAVSGYSHPLYEDCSFWNHRYEFDLRDSIKSLAFTESNHKKHQEGLNDRGRNQEVLWVKE